MKIVVQNFKTGKISVANAPRPAVPDNGILVRTSASLISAGTDRAVVGLANKGYIGKALARPDLVRRVLRKVKNDGLALAFRAVQNVIAEPNTLGYSLVGEVIGVGVSVEGVAIGDRVACAGAGHANHAAVTAIPGNLFVPVPQGVADEDAAYVHAGRHRHARPAPGRPAVRRHRDDRPASDWLARSRCNCAAPPGTR